MIYTQLVKEVADASGLSNRESRAVLDNTVESLASLLPEEEREDFASQLPSELQYLALDAQLVDDQTGKDLLTQFIERQQVDEDEAKTLIASAWQAIKDVITGGEASHLRSQLPDASAALLSL
jgi:uncharacterized protein (DUF2267 family)